jgi:hypothetical protein
MKAHTIIFRSFYIDVGRMRPDTAKQFVEEAKEQLQEKNSKEDDLGDRVTFIDYYLPVRVDGGGGSRVDIQAVDLPGEI